VNEQQLLDRLDRLADNGVGSPDWGDVVNRVPARKRRSPRRLVLLAAALVAAVTLPALALSGQLRALFSEPVLNEATLRISAPVGDGRTARLWTSPSSTGGECMFISLGSHDTDQHPSQGGSGACTADGTRLHANNSDHLELGWDLTNHSVPGRTPPIISGWLPSQLHTARLELHWRTGHKPVPFKGQYFLSVEPVLDRPAFTKLPFYVIAYDQAGKEVSRAKIRSLSLYMDKPTKERMRDYVRAHPGRHIM